MTDRTAELSQLLKSKELVHTLIINQYIMKMEIDFDSSLPVQHMGLIRLMHWIYKPANRRPIEMDPFDMYV